MDASEAEAKSLVAGVDEFVDEERVVGRTLRRGRCALLCLKLKWFLYGALLMLAAIFVAEYLYGVGMTDYVSNWVGTLDLSLSIHNGTVDFHPFANSSTTEATTPTTGVIQNPTAAPTLKVPEPTGSPTVVEVPTGPPTTAMVGDTEQLEPGLKGQPQSEKDVQEKEPKGTWFEGGVPPDDPTVVPSEPGDEANDAETDATQQPKSEQVPDPKAKDNDDGDEQPESESAPEPTDTDDGATSEWFQPDDTDEPAWFEPDMGSENMENLDAVQEVLDPVQDVDKEKAGGGVKVSIDNVTTSNNGIGQLNTTVSGDTSTNETSPKNSTATNQLNSTANNQLNATDEAFNITNSSVEYKPPPVKYQYQRRHEELWHLDTKNLAARYGSWQIVDTKERPTYDYCAEYPNRDIPWEKLPENAWQLDTEFKRSFLAEGKALAMRAMETILEEYGFGSKDLTGDFESRRKKSPFYLTFYNPDDPGERRYLDASTRLNQAGKTTQKSYDGLVRRLLHAVVTRDTFNLVMGGHSAAAGHGNNFQQSYTLQFQRVMEPVFARLGVKHFARNIGMGGLGTVHNAMGAQDIYGRDVDILIWDSSMTESPESPEFDLFARQGILGSDRAPMLWSANDDARVYVALQKNADVDFMLYGSGRGDGVIPLLKDPTHAEEIPWAARYLNCDPDIKSVCDDNRYNGTCWVERPDHFQPPTPQKDQPEGRASWHYGNREHQLYGRVLAFTVLRALWDALDRWEKQPNHVLSDEMWHVTDYYNNIKSKIANLGRNIGTCYDIRDRLPDVFCRIPFQARTEFTPRAYPEETSLRSIMKPFGPDMTLPQPPSNIYDPPDVRLPVLDVPRGQVDYLAIVENGNSYWEFDAPAPTLPVSRTGNRLVKVTVDAEGENIVPGLGWGVATQSSPEFCNGTYDSFCGRSSNNSCLLYGHNDFRGGLTFDSLSGWGVFTLRNLKHGMIFVKMDSWRPAKDNPVTEGWTEVNNGHGGRSLLVSSHDDEADRLLNEGHPGSLRKMKRESSPKGFCPELVLEFAVGERIISIKSDAILGEKHSLVQRVVQIWTVLNEPDFTKGETLDVELGVRLRGCGRQHVFWLTHIYWA